MKAPWTPSMATAARPMQKFTTTNVGPEGASQPTSAPPTRTVPRRVWARKMPGSESRTVVRPAIRHPTTPPNGEAAMTAGTQAGLTASAASVSGSRLATMHIQATGARTRRVGCRSTARTPSSGRGRAVAACRAVTGRLNSTSAARTNVTASMSNAVADADGERDRGAAEDAGDLSRLVDRAAEARGAGRGARS